MSEKTVTYGNHPGIIQSMIDFDYLNGSDSPSVVAIIGVDRKNITFFWGKQIVSIPCYLTAQDMPERQRMKVESCLILQSARRVKSSIYEALGSFTHLKFASVFAEGLPERQAQSIREEAEKYPEVIILGPASVGKVNYGVSKHGAAGGITPTQIHEASLCHPQKKGTALIAVSGGMLNEISFIIDRLGKPMKYSFAVGGDVINLFKPSELLGKLLEDDSVTSIVFYGELGGVDEYKMADIYKQSKSDKPFICYIGGKISENFKKNTPQFGHAKAIARTKEQTASAKVEALNDAGVQATTSIKEFEEFIKNLPDKKEQKMKEGYLKRLDEVIGRKSPLFMSNVSTEHKGDAKLLGKPLQKFIEHKTFSQVGLEMLLGREIQNKKTIELADLVFRLLIDHGPLVSGAVNTIVAARAGRDLASSLASGILTIGDRFGGATNQAAELWLEGVEKTIDPAEFVESMARQGKRIAGIGHKKYSLQLPDPRIDMLREFVGKSGKYTEFADSVAKITTAKKSNLILNVDGAIAATMLDLLEKEEGFSIDELKDLTRAEFFNALFILSRSFGFAAHYMDQKRHDQPLFRLPEDQSGQIV